MKILLFVLSSSSDKIKHTRYNTTPYKERLKNILDTWSKAILPPHRFVVSGDENIYKDNPDNEVWITSSHDYDTYERLPFKILSTLQIALTYKDWDFIIKVDDDTYVHFDKLISFLSNIDPRSAFYCGHSTHDTVYPRYACGGPGYIMSRPALLCAWDELETIVTSSTTTLEDKSIGLAMAKANITLTHSDHFTKHNRHRFSDEEAIASIMNGSITTHPVTPPIIKKIYNLLKLRKM